MGSDRAIRRSRSAGDILERTGVEEAGQRTDFAPLMLPASVFEAIDMGLCLNDEAGLFVHVNPTFCRLFGWSAEELIGQPFTVLLAEEAPATALRVHRRSRIGEVPAPPCRRVRRRDGKPLDLYVSSTSLRTSDGRPLKITAVTDITALKEAERRSAALEERNAVLTAATTACAVGITVADATRPDTPLIFANPAVCRMTGYRPEDLVGRNCRMLQAPDAEPEARAALRRAVADGTAATVEIVNLRRDGSRFVNQVSLSPVRDETGALRYMVGTHIDVTALHAERARLARRERLHGEVRRLAGLGDWRWRIGDPTFEWSDEVYRMFGRDRASFTPTLQAIIDQTHPDDRPTVAAAIARYDEEEPGPERIEGRIVRPDGAVRHLRSTGRRETGPDGAAIVQGLIQDVTDEQETQILLQRVRAASEAANKVKSDFLASMSHELRTPLNPILGFAEIIRDQLFGPVGNPAYVEYAGAIHDSAAFLRDLLADLLDAAQVEIGQVELRRERFDLREVTHRAVGVLLARATAAEIAVEVDLAPDLPPLDADPLRVRQVILNLLSNAIKFSRPNSRVGVRWRRDGGDLVLTVSDEGIGMNPAEIAIAFEPFRQTGPSFVRQREGVGLGLAVTRNLVQAHGGRIGITSAPRQGTTVEARFPLTAEAGGGG